LTPEVVPVGLGAEKIFPTSTIMRVEIGP